MTTLLIAVFFACNNEPTYTCTDAEVLQECDANGENCVDFEDCAADGLMCHAEMGHCMAMEDDDSQDAEDTGMSMEE